MTDKHDNHNVTENHDFCPICNCTRLSTLSDYKKDYLVKCDKCTFTFSKQIPSKEELVDYYQNDYDRTNYFSPITRKRYHQLLDAFEKFRQSNKILDLGCGYGYFLEVAKSRGWEVYGVEIAEDAVHTCKEKGINMFHGEVQYCDFQEDTFDVVISIEVIEHLVNPNIIVQTGLKMLRKDGLFYVTTPNFNSYLRYQLKENFDVIEYPNHLSYFTTKTLDRLFTENGFKRDMENGCNCSNYFNCINTYGSI